MYKRQLTDSEICVRLFADNPVKGRCNKELVQRIRRGIALVKRSDSLSIGWTKAHSTATTLEALGNAAADRLAAQGCAGLSHQMTQPPSPPRTRAPRSSSAGSSLVRAPRRRRRLRSRRDPRLSPVYVAHLSSAQRLVLYRLAGFYRDRQPLWPRSPPLPAGAGDIVGD